MHTRSMLLLALLLTLPLSHASDIYKWVDEDGQVSLEEFKKIYSTHKPEPLADHILLELDRIMAAADLEAQKIGD